MQDSNAKKVTSVDRLPCQMGGPQHPIGLGLENGRWMSAEDGIAYLDAGGVLYMIPPPGAPAREAYEATGLGLVLQVRPCPGCDERLLYA